MRRYKTLLMMALFLVLCSFAYAVDPVSESARYDPSPYAFNNDTLLGYCNASDGDGDNVSYYYVVYENNVEIISNYTYEVGFDLIINYSIPSNLTNPRGITHNDTHIFMLDDSTGYVWRYPINETPTNSTIERMINITIAPTMNGLTNNGTHFFSISDYGASEYLVTYLFNGTYLVDSTYAIPETAIPTDLKIYNDYFYIVDRFNERVYTYTMGGVYSGNYYVGGSITQPEGISEYNGMFYVSSSWDGLIYEYTDTFSFTGNTYNISADGQPYYMTNNGSEWFVNLGYSKVGRYNITVYDYSAESVERNVFNVSSTLTSLGDEFILSCRAYDGSGLSNWTNSSATTILAGILNVTIYDESTGSLMTTRNVTTQLIGDDTQTNISDSGTAMFYLNASGDYDITFNADNFTQEIYTVDIGSNVITFLDVYMLPDTYTDIVTFTILDDDTGQVVEGAAFSVSKLINNTPTQVASLSSDVTGKVEFNYESGQCYDFVVIMSGYTTKNFGLCPILRSTYNVRIAKSTTITSDNDYSKVAITYSPYEYDDYFLTIIVL